METGPYGPAARTLRVTRQLTLLWLDLWRLGVRLTITSLRTRGTAEV